MSLTSKVKMVVLSDNLKAQQRELEKLSRIRLSNLADAARVADDFLIDAGHDGETFVSALKLLRERCREEKSIFSENQVFETLRLDDQYVFTSLLAKRLYSRLPELLYCLLPVVNSRGRVSFVPNNITEECLLHIKGTFLIESLLYASDFKDAAMKVATGEADFCLLPYAENDYFPIHSIFDITMKADLLLIGKIKTDCVTYGIYAKGLPCKIAKTLAFQYALPLQVPIPMNMESQAVERFAFRYANQLLRVDTWAEEDLPAIITGLLYFQLFAPDVKITGCAQTFQI